MAVSNKIPEDWREWGLNLAAPSSLADTLSQNRNRAFLFRDLATLRTDIPLFTSVEQLKWLGPTAGFPALAASRDASVQLKGNLKLQNS